MAIFTFAAKLQENSDFQNWPDYLESHKIDSTQSAQLKSFENLDFSYNFVASASLNIDINKFFN
jgi:hypothetical protein